MRTILKLLLLILLLPVLYVATTVVYLPAVVWHGFRAPAASELMEIRVAAAAAEGRDLEIRYRWVPLDGISPHLMRAVLAAEDTKFYDHRGFDWEQIRSAWEANREGGKPLRGASTITQQTVKNLYLSPSRNVLRKVREAILTAWMETWVPKDRILELYLNVVELGPGVFGAEAASQLYFGRPAARLTREQAALLAATLPAPLLRNPGSPTPGLRRRQAMILSRMSRWYEGPSLAAEEATGEVEVETLPEPREVESAPLDVEGLEALETDAADPAPGTPSEADDGVEPALGEPGAPDAAPSTEIDATPEIDPTPAPADTGAL